MFRTRYVIVYCNYVTKNHKNNGKKQHQQDETMQYYFGGFQFEDLPFDCDKAIVRITIFIFGAVSKKTGLH